MLRIEEMPKNKFTSLSNNLEIRWNFTSAFKG